MKIDANWDPLLLMIFLGMLCIFYMSFLYILVTFPKKIKVIMAMSLLILENWSTITKIAFLYVLYLVLLIFLAFYIFSYIVA